MIYITGDTHGKFSRFKNKTFHANENDTVIICGDFGGIWDNSPTQDYWLKWLSQKPYTILFCCGNHENFDTLYQYPVVDYAGGKAHQIAHNIYHLMRGEVFRIEEKTFFVMGGAASHDISDGILDPTDKNFKHQERVLKKQGKKMYRIAGVSWWPQELPSQEEYDHAKDTLQAYHYTFDYIITHDCPSTIQKQIDDSYPCNALNEFHQFVAEHCTFRQWFFGHYHQEMEISNKYQLIYKNIIALNDK